MPVKDVLVVIHSPKCVGPRCVCANTLEACGEIRPMRNVSSGAGCAVGSSRASSSDGSIRSDSNICDFACVEVLVVVELDGSQHAVNLEYDLRRDRFLRSAGFEILHLWNNDGLRRTEEVLDTIYAALDRVLSPPPLRGTSPFEWGGLAY